jgi:long-chain fatty acid transport protein
MCGIKSLIAKLLAAAVLICPAGVFAAGFQNMGQSANSTAMGYSGVANPNEPNSSFYNPANMAFGEGMKAYLGGTLIMPSTDYQPFENGETIDTDDRFFPPPNAHLSYENIADTNVSAGVGLTLPFGLGITWPREWIGRTNIISQDLRTYNINPNVAYKLPGIDLAVAGGLQFMLSDIEFEQSIALSDDQFVDAFLGGNGTGFGGVAALMYKPLEDLTLGFQYRSRVSVDYEGDVHFSGEEDTPFFGTFRDNPAETSITFPDLLNLGVGYQLERLFLTADVNYTLWETYDEIIADIDTGDDEQAIDNFSIVNNWDNAFAFRLGAQYDLTESIPARVGFSYDMTPIPEETVNASLPDNDRIIGTLGLGYNWQSLRADLGYSLVYVDEREIRNERAPNGFYNTASHNVAFNVGYGY